jgi:hypothetical protein
VFVGVLEFKHQNPQSFMLFRLQEVVALSLKQRAFSSRSKDIDVAVYGATGYTGKLVAEYFKKKYGTKGEVKWALAGRSQEKLEATRDELSLGNEIPLIVADSSNDESIRSMVERSKVVLTTVGNFPLFPLEMRLWFCNRTISEVWE